MKIMTFDTHLWLLAKFLLTSVYSKVCSFSLKKTCDMVCNGGTDPPYQQKYPSQNNKPCSPKIF